MERVILSSEEETLQLARKIVPMVKKGTIITLDGDLGSGKTFFTSCLINEIAKNRSLPKQNVISPTFNILKIYDLQDIVVYHYDLYRIKNTNELYELNVEVAFQNVAIIEWPKIIESLLPSITIAVKIITDGDRRIFELKYGK